MPLDPGTETDFRYELARILGSSTFNSAAKQRDLIKWLVEQTLTASEPSFSQFEIATQALGYKDSFDSTSDSRVRTAMRRLREKLATYYQTEGRLNRFRIVIEDGKYAPELVRPKPLLSPAPSRSVLPTPSDKLSVLVLPVLPIGFRDEQCFCDGLTLNLMRAIAAGGQARVVPWTTSHWLAEKTGDKREHYLKTNADVILEPLVQQVSGDRCNITVQWVDGPTGLFDTFYEVKAEAGNILATVDELAGKLADSLRITYDERTRSQLALRHTSDPAALTFYLKARRDAMIFTPPTVRRAFEFLGHALSRDPYFAAAFALQAELHLAVGDSGAAPARPQAALAREAGENALRLAPELGDALAARGAIELTHDWDLPLAEKTLTMACADPLADGAPHWPPILELSRGHAVEGAAKFESWARLDPASGSKAGVACEFWYLARQFEFAIQWGLLALELEPKNLRAGLLLAASFMEAGREEESLRLARNIQGLASEFCEPNLMLAALLARAGHLADAGQVVKTWNLRKGPVYESPTLWAIAYAWLGETALAMEAMQRVVEDRLTVCLFARQAPFFAPLHGLPEFDRLLTNAGIPQPDL